MSMQSWSSLPTHLLERLFADLGAQELLSAGAVCATWRRATGSDFLWAAVLAPIFRETKAKILGLHAARKFGDLTLRQVYLYTRLISRNGAVPFLLEDWFSNDIAPNDIKRLSLLHFDLQRHIKPTPLNALRLLRLLICRGTDAVTAVATTCAMEADPPGYASCRIGTTLKSRRESNRCYRVCFSGRRGVAFRRLFGMCLGLFVLLPVGACATLYALCHSFLPTWIAFTLFVWPPCFFGFFVWKACSCNKRLDAHQQRARYVGIGGNIALALLNAVALYRHPGHFFTPFAMTVRACVLTVGTLVWSFLRIDPFIISLLIGAMCGTLDVLSPIYTPILLSWFFEFPCSRYFGPLATLMQGVYFPRHCEPRRLVRE